MLKDITLGQYFPGDTLAHRLDPRTKLLATVLYIIAIFLAKGPIAYGVLILTLIVSVRISKVGAKALFRGLKPVLFIIAFTAVLNLFYTPGTVIAQFWIFKITKSGIQNAVFNLCRAEDNWRDTPLSARRRNGKGKPKHKRALAAYKKLSRIA